MNKNQIQTRKLALAGVLVALAVVCSPLSIPVGASKCFPIQHLVNVVAAVFLGPAYGVGMAFCTSFIRNILGTGSLLAFPGSMIGALVCGIVWKKSKVIGLTCLGEVFGTAVLGGLTAWPVAAFVMGKEAAMFTYVVPFAVSTIGGSAIAMVLVTVLKRSGAFDAMERSLNRR